MAGRGPASTATYMNQLLPTRRILRPRTFLPTSARTVFAFVLALGMLVAPEAAVAASASSPPGLTWSALSPPTSPPALVDAVAAYDSANATVVVFGGQLQGGQLSAQTWVWNGSTWSKAALFGASPAPREMASMAFDTALDPPQLILFGGRGDDGTLLDDTWTWNGSSWNQVASATGPGGREGAAMAADAAGRLVLFGGYGRTSPSPGTATTTTTLPAATSTTTTTLPTTTTTTVPASTTTAPSTTTTTVPTTTAPTTTGPPTTAPPTTAAPTTAPPTTIATTTDSTDSTDPVPSPPTTAGSRAQADGSGPAQLTATVAPPQVLDDTWVLGTAGGVDVWTQVAAAVHPPPTTSASMATGASGQTLLFGGTSRAPGDDQTTGATRQTWVYQNGSWAHVKMAAAPAARLEAAMAYDADLGDTVLYGGDGGKGTLGDTWLWNGAGWQAAAPASPPSARAGAAAAYDDASRHLVAFGGSDSTGAALSSTEVLGAHAPIVVPTSGSPTTATGAPPGTGPAATTTTTGGGSSAFGSTSATSTTLPVTTTAPATSTPTPVHRGDVITLTGGGFLPDTDVTITFHSVTTTIGLAVTNADGFFSKTVEVPNEAAIGHHHFEALGKGRDGMIKLIKPVSVIAVAATRHTSTRTKLILVGVALAIPLVSWMAFDLAGRRRVTLRR